MNNQRGKQIEESDVVDPMDDMDGTIMGLADLGLELFAKDANELLAEVKDGCPEDCAQHLEYLAKLIRELLPESEAA